MKDSDHALCDVYRKDFRLLENEHESIMWKEIFIQ